MTCVIEASCRGESWTTEQTNNKLFVVWTTDMANVSKLVSSRRVARRGPAKSVLFRVVAERTLGAPARPPCSMATSSSKLPLGWPYTTTEQHAAPKLSKAEKRAAQARLRPKSAPKKPHPRAAEAKADPTSPTPRRPGSRPVWDNSTARTVAERHEHKQQQQQQQRRSRRPNSPGPRKHGGGSPTPRKLKTPRKAALSPRGTRTTWSQCASMRGSNPAAGNAPHAPATPLPAC